MEKPARLAIPSALLLLSLSACSTLDMSWQWPWESGQEAGNPGAAWVPESPADTAARLAREPTTGGRVLAAAIQMIEQETIVVGACWDYVNAVFNKAGFPASKRLTLYQTSERGPFADPTLLRPGDWIYFVNHTFSDVGHSAIFVDWIDVADRRALTVEYVGRYRRVPGRYAEYDISECYGVFRGTE